MRVGTVFAMLAGLAAMAALPASANAGEARVAVAANFTAVAEEIGALFEAASGHKAVFSFGATGQLYTQIREGAPFDVFLAADQQRPALAVEEGLALASSRRTYAIGRIVLYSADPALVTGPETLEAGQFGKLAIANPQTAPYGTAAIEAMEALGVAVAIRPKLVQGANIAQTLQFVETGNAELGFVALSQVIASTAGSRWIVPEDLHAPIAQDAVLLDTGAGNEAALAFVEFLQGAEARAVKEKFGYGAGGD